MLNICSKILVSYFFFFFFSSFHHYSNGCAWNVKYNMKRLCYENRLLVYPFMTKDILKQTVIDTTLANILNTGNFTIS